MRWFLSFVLTFVTGYFLGVVRPEIGNIVILFVRSAVAKVKSFFTYFSKKGGNQ